MVRTKLVARNNYNQRKKQFKRANQRRPNPKKQRAGVKNIDSRIRNRDIKTKQLIPQPKNVQVRKNRNVVRRMVVRLRTIYPAERKNVVYSYLI